MDDRDKTAGSEARYHFPAVDDARFDEATAVIETSGPGSGESCLCPESKINTLGGPARGAVGGASYGCDKGFGGF